MSKKLVQVSSDLLESLLNVNCHAVFVDDSVLNIVCSVKLGTKVSHKYF